MMSALAGGPFSSSLLVDISRVGHRCTLIGWWILIWNQQMDHWRTGFRPQEMEKNISGCGHALFPQTALCQTSNGHGEVFEMKVVTRTLSNIRSLSRMTLVGLTLCMAAALLPGSVHAGTLPYSIYGYVYDVDGTPVVGATVVVSVWDNDNEKTTLPSTETSGDGFYECAFFDGSIWDPDKPVEVTADTGTKQMTVTDTLVAGDSMQIDVDFRTLIPQFGTTTGFAVAAGLVGIIAIMILPRVRRD